MLGDVKFIVLWLMTFDLCRDYFSNGFRRYIGYTQPHSSKYKKYAYYANKNRNKFSYSLAYGAF